MNNYNSSWKIPHIIKIPEAFTAIADERYEDHGNTLSVFSSDFSKQYTVERFLDGYASNDNMSYNNGIMGYPIVVALMLEKKLPFDIQIALLFSKINWNETNIKHNKDFSLSMTSVIKNIMNEKYNYDLICKHIRYVYKQLKDILPNVKRYNSTFSFENSKICQNK